MTVPCTRGEELACADTGFDLPSERLTMAVQQNPKQKKNRP